MKKIPKKKRKVTELYFNEYDSTAKIYTYNTKLKKLSKAAGVNYQKYFLTICASSLLGHFTALRKTSQSLLIS